MRQILHVDMDAFYASVEQLDNPKLRNRPVIVGADPKGGAGRGVVAACSYEARSYGIHSALPISQAWKRCPAGIYLRPRVNRYAEVSCAVMGILKRYTDLVEPLSIDEAFLDVTGSLLLLGAAPEIARNIKVTVRNETGLTASVGVAPNKFLAKIASDLNKPDGLVVVPETKVRAFLGNLPLSRLWGVGPKTEAKLRRLGAQTIGELAEISPETLIQTMGASGAQLARLARGDDDRPVIAGRELRSVSNETTFDADTGDRDRIVGTLRKLSDKVAARLRRRGCRARTVTLKLRYASFTTHSRQTSLPAGTDTGNQIFAAVLDLFQGFSLDEKVRLVGVGTHNLVNTATEATQPSLFHNPAASTRLEDVLDELHDRYGEASLRRASDLS